jgi:hypothetical protein
MFGISPSEPCTIANAQWYDKGFLRIGFKAGSETLSCFINAYDEKVGDDIYVGVLRNITNNIIHVFDLHYDGPKIKRETYLKWIASKLDAKKGAECRIKVGLSRKGAKFIIMSRYVFSPFIEKNEGTPRLRYSEYERENYGPKDGLSFVPDEMDSEEQDIFFEDFDIPNF